jgi:hypothetical protein
MAETAIERGYSLTIHNDLSEESRERLRQLTLKSAAEALSEAERVEYIALAEQREQADAERLLAIATLAKLHNVSPADLIETLKAGTKKSCAE